MCNNRNPSPYIRTCNLTGAKGSEERCICHKPLVCNKNLNVCVRCPCGRLELYMLVSLFMTEYLSLCAIVTRRTSEMVKSPIGNGHRRICSDFCDQSFINSGVCRSKSQNTCAVFLSVCCKSIARQECQCPLCTHEYPLLQFTV